MKLLFEFRDGLCVWKTSNLESFVEPFRDFYASTRMFVLRNLVCQAELKAVRKAARKEWRKAERKMARRAAKEQEEEEEAT